MRWLFIFFVIVTFGGITADGVIGYIMWQHRGNDPTMNRVARNYLARFIKGVFFIGANCFGFITDPKYTIGYAICYWIGLTIETCSSWDLLLALKKNRETQ